MPFPIVSSQAAREKLLALAAKQKIKLNPDWKPTSLIAVINARCEPIIMTAVISVRRRPTNISIRSDLSDMDKVKLAAKAKMEGNLADLLPKKYKGGRELEDKEDELEGRLVFTDTNTTEASETVDPNKKWSTVVFSELPSDPAKSDGDMKKEKVSSLTKRFETKNMKDNEAYVIM